MWQADLLILISVVSCQLIASCHIGNVETLAKVPTLTWVIATIDEVSWWIPDEMNIAYSALLMPNSILCCHFQLTLKLIFKGLLYGSKH